MPLALPILDSTELNPSDTFLLPSIFTEPFLDTPESFQSSISVPIVGKRHHDETLVPTDVIKKPASRKGKKLKTDKNTKRERNKVSAAKYRQRRKVYIDGLEDHVRQLNEKLEAQSKAITSLKTENQMLKDQVSYLKKLVDSFRCTKTPASSVSPINQFIKAESSFGSALKPMGAGLFLLALCCLVFSFHSFNDAGAMSSIPVRSSSRTLLHHEDGGVLLHDDEPTNDSTASPFSAPVNSNSHPPDSSFSSPIDGVGDSLIDVDLSLEPTLEMMETIVNRHNLHGSAAA
jgi:hypothetical protein